MIIHLIIRVKSPASRREACSQHENALKATATPMASKVKGGFLLPRTPSKDAI